MVMESEDRARKRRKKEKVEYVGRYVRKEFEGYGVFMGKVVSFTDGLYRVDYEDGDFEDLEVHEVAEILAKKSDFDKDYTRRKKELDELIRKKQVDETATKNEAQTSKEDLDRIESPPVSKLSSDLESGAAKGLGQETIEKMDIELEGTEKPSVDGDADSSSDSCEFVQVRDLSAENEAPLVPPPELPSSSGSMCVPEESAAHLFSVYSFLRSFSIQLFLSPFKLDDFVGSLNYRSSNNLMDAVHLSLLRALRRHLEMLSSDDANRASKCLRRLDWSLLDTLTWPVYLVEYLLVMGYAKGPEWQGFYTDVLDREYYSISVTKKLMVLQILCDDVMESAELRAEIDMRGSLADGSDINGSANPLPPLNGPTRVHPKYSKTSACKDMEAINVKPCNSKATLGTNFGSKVPELDTGTTDVDQDANSDECQLCGMDGILLCCDGCPSAYHSRCIGLNKMLIPDGVWFCPECTTKNIEPTLRISAGLRGAEIFGIDPHEQIFLGICNHLLVINVSTDAGPPFRYYNETDIPKVFQVLCSTEQHKTSYSEICKSIMQYWEMLEDSILSLSESFEAENNTATDTNEETKASLQIYPPDELINAVEGENCASSVTVGKIENGMLSDRENDCQEVRLKSTSLETVNQDIQPGLPREDDSSAPKILPFADTKSCEQFRTESLVSSGSIYHCPELSDLTQQSCVERSTGLDFSTCANGTIEKKVIDGILLPTKNDTLSTSCEKVEGKSNGDGTSERDKNDGSLYVGNHFMPQSYINQYFLGDIAASAAANFAVLASEEKGVTEAHTSSNPRKIVSANIALQLKAFTLASIPFIWPNSDKKATEVPRERCGWCLSCKALTTSRKGCFLNLAAVNAIKGSARNIVGLRSIKNVEGSILGIATYIIWMAESLRGLLVGPFLSSSYRKRWQKEVEKASSCSALKFSLLELEEHIRLVAFSGDWVKLVDDWMGESSAAQNTTASAGAPPRRPGGRRTRKQAAISEVAKDPGDDDLRIVRWWRGGKLSKLVFQKGILPCSIIKKAARQGGRRKISGIHYAEGSEIPKRSRRFAWRAAVELSKNAPQLALQVRYLDLHLRWSDMVISEQNFHDGKGTDAETSAYRNAYICDKKIEENRTRYGLVFNQKHLPSRVLKNTIDVDQNDEEDKRFWFFETHVPLYLIKEYEQKVEKDPSPPAKTSHVLSKLQRKQLKASRRNIFSYLVQKKEKVDKCSCASCQEDLLLGDAVKCHECEGYCHKGCTSHSTVVVKGEMDSVIICNQCAKAISLNENIYKTPVSQSMRQGQGDKMVGAVTKDSRVNGDCQPLTSAGGTATHSLVKSTIPGRNLASRGKRGGTLASYGIIWKKKYSEEIGTDFRLRNILLRANGDIDSSKRPTCHHCSKPYNPDLMYICCEECKLWYHADAVQLNESQLFDVLGFKCCKCRRSRLPICPYADPESRKSRVSADPESRKQRARASKPGNIVVEPRSETISKPLVGWEITTPASSENMEGIVEEEDPLLFSLERVEPVSEFTSDLGAEWDTAGASFQGPQKLPVRRHVKVENDPVNEKLTIRRPFNENNGIKDVMFEYEGAKFEDMDFEPQTYSSQNASPPQAEWDIPDDGIKAEWDFTVDGVKDEMFDYEAVNLEDMEFEPQTYFSYTELLATDDNQSSLLDGSTINSADCVAPPYNNVPDQYGMGTRIKQEEFDIPVEPCVNVSCRMCSLTKPAPDLSCDVCGMQIHNQCSPWGESTWGDRWRCGNCRDWA